MTFSAKSKPSVASPTQFARIEIGHPAADVTDEFRQANRITKILHHTTDTTHDFIKHNCLLSVVLSFPFSI